MGLDRGRLTDDARGHHQRLGGDPMPHLCSFVPPHVLANIARVHAREGLEPTAAQRSAIVSQQLRRERSNFAPDGVVRQAISAGPEAVPEGLTVPPPGTAGRLIYDDQNQWSF